ncbi:adhesion G protein-coupled receptor L4-like isoform X2 [Gigantopelta aegis]|uniref:adhesion G protein-coupled receptor L4-like isoform X2 n=1 Tax=Gigantopelta aegis TaxID=1735272 RepID=UPI001B88CFF0|nr:adhesion G protein-coupled receptor L4-like isoform X2 [Gigantopelta aegis]
MDGLLTSRILFVALGCMLFFNKVLAEDIECTGQWTKVHRGCYKFDTEKKTWDEAKAACQEDGGDLTSIASMAERKKVLSKLQKVITSDGLLTWWVGLRRGTGAWTWEDGTEHSDRIVQWAPGEPNNRRGKEHCVELKFDGKLNDKNCQELRPFICEKYKLTTRPPLETTAPAVTATPTTTPAVTLGTTTVKNTSPTEHHTTQATTTSKPATTATQTLKTSTTTTQTLKTSTTTTPMTTRRDSKSRARTTVSLLTSTTWEERLSPFLGCYQIDSSNFLNYDPSAPNCPRVHAFNQDWPETPVHSLAEIPCRQGTGTTTWRCWSKPTCWRGEPDFADCASPKFNSLLQKVKVTDGPTASPEEQDKQMMDISKILADVTEDDVTAEDVMVTTKVISSFSASAGSEAKSSDVKTVKSIVMNIVKAGSNLVSEEKQDTWREMSSNDKVRSASALLNAMETATMTMVNNIAEPTNFSRKDDNIDLKIEVVDVSGSDVKKVVYNEESLQNTVSIPIASLKNASKDGLAKVVFMTHYKMADLLDDSTPSGDKDSTKPNKIASSILSISLGTERIKLVEPVTFTMRLVKKLPPKMMPLCSFWDMEDYPGSWSQEGCQLAHGNSTHVTCQSDHLTNFAILMDVQGIKMHVVHSAILQFITLVGCVISMICLFVCWLTFQCLGSIQGERNSIHKNLVVCLFFAEVLFLTGINRTENQLACTLIAAVLHYFFLCMFTWMLIEGLHMVFMLTQVFDAAKSRLPYYYMVAYGGPAAVVAVSAGAYHQGYGTELYCWLTTEHYFIWSFAGPVAVILLANAVILVYTMSMVCRHSEYVMNTKEKDSANFRTWVQGALSMEVMLGLTWIFGYFYISQATVALAYIFTVLNSLQGLLIFCFHCLLNRKVMKEYRRIFHIRKRKPASSTQSQSLVRKHSGSYEVSGRSHETNC